MGGKAGLCPEQLRYKANRVESSELFQPEFGAADLS